MPKGKRNLCNVDPMFVYVCLCEHICVRVYVMPWFVNTNNAITKTKWFTFTLCMWMHFHTDDRNHSPFFLYRSKIISG